MSRKAHLVALLAAVTAIGPFSLQALAPALGAVRADFAVSAPAAQLMLSLSLAAMAVSTLVWGPVSDRLGRRPVLVFGLAAAAVGSGLAAVAPTLALAVLGRLLQAVGAVAGMVLARAVAQDLYGRRGAAGVIGQITAAMVVAPMVAPALSGLVVETVGWRGIFGIVGVAAAGLALWARASLPETAPPGRRESPRATLGAFAAIARRRVFWAHAVFGASSMSAFMFFVGAAPYVMQEAYGAGPAIYGLFFMPLAATYMLANMLCGRLTARHGGRWMILAGGGLTLVAMLAGLVAVAAGLANPLGLMLPAFLHSFGAGLAVPNSVAGAIGSAPERAGAASGLLSFSQFLCAAAASQAAGLVAHGSAAPTLGGMALLAGLGLAGYLALDRAAPAAPATGG